MRQRCARCDELVIVVDVRGTEVIVDADELEAPPLRCPQCGGRRRAEPCSRCDGTGTVGEPIPVQAIAINEFGLARRWTRHRPRHGGEALYREHVCWAWLPEQANVVARSG